MENKNIFTKVFIVIIAFALGVGFIFFGRLVNDVDAEQKNSNDIRVVDAEITSVTSKRRDLTTEEYYQEQQGEIVVPFDVRVSYSFTIDDHVNTFSESYEVDKEEYIRQSVGDIVSIKVYKNSKGEYHRYQEGASSIGFIFYIVGVLAIIYGVYAFIRFFVMKKDDAPIPFINRFNRS